MSLKKIVLFSALILFATFAIVRVGLFAIEVQHDSELVVIGGATVEYILDPTELSKGEGALSADFDVTSTSSVVVQKDGALYEIIHNATGGSAFTLMFKEAAPYSFALDSSNTVLTVAGGYFGMLDISGKTVDSVPLPIDDMRLARSSLLNVVYLFGGMNGDYRLYSFAEEGKFQVLLQTEEPIVAVTDDGRDIYVAIARRIVRVGVGRPAVVFGAVEAELGGEIISLAASLSDEVLFFSTSSRVYALRGAAAVSIVNNSGGSLRVRGDALYVLDRSRGMLYTIRPITEAIFSGVGP